MYLKLRDWDAEISVKNRRRCPYLTGSIASASQDCGGILRDSRRRVVVTPIQLVAHVLILSVIATILGCDGYRKPATTVQSTNPNSSRPTESAAASAPSQKLNPELRAAFALIGERKTDDARTALAQYMSEHPNDGQAVFLYALS